jgi:formyltetrahydrofolate-dependent phosphoribosylglycinamide formyltransferase
MRIAVLLSGNGRSLQNLIDRSRAGRLAAQIVLVISNKADAFGLRRARTAGISTHVVTKKENPGERFSQRIFGLCRDAEVKLVCLAGFLQLLTIPDDFAGRVLNIHPALLPKFGGHGMFGHHVHEAVLAAGETVSGCTVHIANNEYDRGPIILQKQVLVLLDDTAETLAARVFEAECEAYPEAITKWRDLQYPSDTSSRQT